MPSNKEEMEQMCYDPKCKGCPEYKGGKDKMKVPKIPETDLSAIPDSFEEEEEDVWSNSKV